MFDKSKKLTKEIWWLLVLTGIAGVVFGLLALLWPGLTLATLVYMFAIFTVVGGAFALFESISNIKKDRLWWLTLLFALVNIGVGVYLLRNPLVAAQLFVILLAIVIFIQAIFDLIVASYATKDEGRWTWIFSGILGLIAGVAIMVYPLASSIAFVWVLGLYALIHGVVAVAYAVQIRSEIKKLTK
jgi:uncharacterized membrane protein HdeD (DUF308 family)